MSACALILLILPTTAQSQSDADLGAQLTRHLSTMKKDRQVLRFLETHDWLLSDPRFAASAKRQLRLHTQSLARTRQRAAAAKLALAQRARGTVGLAAVEAANAPERDLPRLRQPLPAGARGLALRVGPPHGRAERPVPRPVPDGLERTAPLRARRFGRRAGPAPPTGTSSPRAATGVPGPASPGVSLTGAPRHHVSSAKCGTRPRGRVPTAPLTW